MLSLMLPAAIADAAIADAAMCCTREDDPSTPTASNAAQEQIKTTSFLRTHTYRQLTHQC